MHEKKSHNINSMTIQIQATFLQLLHMEIPIKAILPLAWEPPKIYVSREIGCYNDSIALKFDRHLGSTAAEVPVKFQSDWKCLNPNLAASRLHEILR